MSVAAQRFLLCTAACAGVLVMAGGEVYINKDQKQAVHVALEVNDFFHLIVFFLLYVYMRKERFYLLCGCTVG